VPNTTADDLRRIALEQFSTVGFAGASLGSIAEEAGMSKSSVLYHYSSKEALLDAAVAPAVEKLHAIIDGFAPAGEEGHGAFVVAFVDFVLEHGAELHIFINQGQALGHVGAIGRANQLVERLAVLADAGIPTVEGRVRFGMALGGAAYLVAATRTFAPSVDPEPAHEVRSALILSVTQLLAPLPSAAHEPRSDARAESTPPAHSASNPAPEPAHAG
jgi:AcrR family transcriptional regulator